MDIVETSDMEGTPHVVGTSNTMAGSSKIAYSPIKASRFVVLPSEIRTQIYEEVYLLRQQNRCTKPDIYALTSHGSLMPHIELLAILCPA